ncbi:MAG: hypothetical protein DI628_00510 [Blastochloris viridis]|uniref:MobA/VirD2-like nuclease domain-containing protein n=1 Tax=Blastochloris viridis TaxID=1079 RepID=A0A6N4RAS1_BLAVI|nr:MAG: hypothetical protein DI628_00510 [Blastochloris viridis]
MAHVSHNRDPSLWEHPWWRKQRRDGLEEEVAPILNAMRLKSHGYHQQARSGRPEVVVKIVSGAMGKGAVKNIMDYIARDADYMREDGHQIIELETQDGQILTTEAERDALIRDWGHDFEAPERYKRQAWKRDLIQQLEYERRQLGYQQIRTGLSGKEDARLAELNLSLKTLRYKQGGKVVDLNINAPKDTVHMLLSVGGQGHKNEAAKQAVRQFLNDNFGSNGYEYLIAQHTDTENLHYHVILKARNRMTGERLQFDKEDLFNLRQEFTYQLTMYGIERAATLRQDRVATYESIRKQRETMETNLSWFESKVARAQAVDAFGAKGNALKQTERLLGMAKETLAKASKEEAKGLKQEITELELHKKDLLTLKPGQFEKEREATVKQINQDHEKIMAKRALKPIELPPARRRRKEQNERIWIKRHQLKIDETVKILTKMVNVLSPESRSETQKTIEMLTALKVSMKKSIRI